MANPVRTDAEYVMSNAQYVSINNFAIDTYAETHADATYDLPAWDQPVFLSQDDGYTPTQIIDFFMLGNVLNFCFNDFETGEKWATPYEPWKELTGDHPAGAFGMWAALKRTLETPDDPDLLDADVLATLTVEEAEQIFKPVTDVEIPLLERRVGLLNDTGHTLREHYDGTFTTLFKQANGVLYNDGDGIVERLVDDFTAYRDTWAYHGRSVRFDKRAQLAPTMLLGKFQGSDRISFTDIDSLTLFADYGIPVVLRDVGILEYDTRLASKIDAGEEIPAGSDAEIELRAATVIAGDRLMDTLNQYRDDPVFVPKLDYFLWKQRREANGKAHLTETTAY